MSSRLDDSVRTLFKSGGFLLFGFVLELGLSFLAKLIVARELSVGDFGSIALAMTIATFGATMVQIGLQNSIARYLPRYDTPADRRGVLVTVYGIVVPLGAGVGLALALGAPLLANQFFDLAANTRVLQIFGGVLFLMVVTRLVISTAQGMKRSGPKVVLENVVRPLSQFAAVAVVLYVGVTATRVAWAYVVGWLVPATIGAVYVVIKTPLFDRSTPANTRPRELLRFSVPLLLTSTLALVFADIDKLMLGYFGTSANVGVYDVVYSLGKLLMTGLLAFSFVFMPVVSELHVDNNHEELRRLYQVVTKWIIVVTVPVFLMMALFPDTLISATFGTKYTAGSSTLRVLAVGFSIHAVAGLNSDTLVSFGETRVLLYVNATAALVNVGLNLVLIPLFGPLGAGISTTATYLALNGLISAYLYRSAGIVPFNHAVTRPVAVAVVLVGVLYAATRLVVSPTPLVLVAFFCTFAVAYAIILLRYGAIESEEVMLVKSIEERFGVDLSPFKRVAQVFFREPRSAGDGSDADAGDET